MIESGAGIRSRTGAHRHELLLVGGLLVGLTVLMTWPQTLLLSTHVNDHGDPLLNVWALAWVAHQLPRDPLQLFDANIFYPERATLAYSESLVLPAVAVAPLRWIGVSPVVTYNLVMLAAFPLSGLAMFALIRRLTGSVGAGLVAAASFAFLPYRFDHYPQLQLQLAMWMPLALWGLHRTLDSGRLRDGLAMGAFVACQAWSCLYYVIFFAPYVVIVGCVLIAGSAFAFVLRGAVRQSHRPLSRAGKAAVLILITAAIVYLALGLNVWAGHPLDWSSGAIRIRATRAGRLFVIAFALAGAAALILSRLRWTPPAGGRPGHWGIEARRRIVALATGAALAVALTLPLVPPYLASRSIVGERASVEIGGAVPGNYLGAPPSSRVYGTRLSHYGGGERYLFPGFTIAVLALIGLWPPWSPIRLAYAAGLLFAFDASRGLDGVSYPLLYERVPPFRALRAASRMGLLTAMTLSILGGLGTALFLRTVSGWRAGKGSSTVSRRSSGLWSQGFVAGVVLLVLVESASFPLVLQRVPRNPPEVSRWLATVPPSAVLELPLGVADTLLMYFSTWHWQHLANGFSGFFPESHTRLKKELTHFPDDASLDAVRALGIDLIVVHERYMPRREYRRITQALDRRTDVRLVATFGPPASEQRVYSVSPHSLPGLSGQRASRNASQSASRLSSVTP